MMDLYQAKPAFCQAFQFKGGVPGQLIGTIFRNQSNDGWQMWVQNRKETVPLRLGDFVIKEPKGEGYYPCDPETFQERWEKTFSRNMIDLSPEALIAYVNRVNEESDDC